MSLIEISKPFEAYLVEDEPSAAGRGREFVLILPFENESAGTMGFKRYLWKYSPDQEAEDQRAGFDGLAPRREAAIKMLREHVERELAENGERLYEVPGKQLLVWGIRKT